MSQIPGSDPLASRELAEPARRATAQIQGPDRPRAVGCGVEPPAAARGLLGGRGPACRSSPKAQCGEAFLLQGGDCAESFEDCESDNIAKRLKVLLQMSLVLLQGMKKPIIRVGRFAGQYAKPRSADTETRDGVTLPTYCGDNVNRPGFSAAKRSRIRSCCCAGTARLARLEFVRALIDGGFADLHHPQYWDLSFRRHRAPARGVSEDVDSTRSRWNSSSP